MKTAVEDFIYTGGISHSLYRTKATLDPSRCAFSVAEYGRVTDWHQCSRKPVESIDGHKFCKLHAQTVNQKLGRLNSTAVRYAASLRNGEPRVAKVNIVNETDKTINVHSVEWLVGHGFLMTGAQRRDSQYTREYEFFDDKNNAIFYLIGEAESHVRSCEQALRKAEETYKTLLDAWHKK